LGLDCFHVGRTKALESENRNDENYFRKGIGTNLIENAIFWAQTHEIKTVIAYAGIDSFPEFNLWSGRLPLKVYMQHAFQVIHSQEAIQNIPGHLQDLSSAADSAKMKMGIVARTL
jgi:GNAT superfamily N-acetyltransferase